MGMYTTFKGDIKIENKELLKYFEILIKNDADTQDEHFPFNWLIDSKIKGNTLKIDQFERNYDNEMEFILELISILDKRAKGEVYYEEPDDGEKGKIFIENGKLFKSKIKEIYEPKKSFTSGYDKEDYLEDINEEIKKFASALLCDRCKAKLDFSKFDFTKRGYYDIIIQNTPFRNLCEKCYKEVKKPFAEKKALEEKLEKNKEELNKYSKSKSEELK